uniref:uncharacterized protein LOC122594617 n=1 Tax=Erigeron canadensis TaxID=72917 RepID=UPI001CB8BCD3|nr:uncharacterized protein LOC122594617 [Erigeron canadensis]
MELHILTGLNQRVRPVTAVTFLYFLIPGLKTLVDTQGSFPNIPSSRLLFNIQTDIRFTKFKPSTLAASAILVGSHQILPWSDSEFLKKISLSKFVKQSELEECFDELKTHVISDHLLSSDQHSGKSEFDLTYRWFGVRRKSKAEICRQIKAKCEIEQYGDSILPKPEEPPLKRSLRNDYVHNRIKCVSFKGLWNKANAEDTKKMEENDFMVVDADPILVQAVKALEVI